MGLDSDEVGSCHCITCSKKAACSRIRIAADAGKTVPRPRRFDDGRPRDECAPKPRLPNDIIIRNKRAVKKYSQQQHDLKRIQSRESVRLFPWAPDSPFRRKCTIRKVNCKRKKIEPRKKSSLIDMLKDDQNCTCELMSRAVGADVHRHLGLISRRDDINAGLTIPRLSILEEPITEPEPAKK